MADPNITAQAPGTFGVNDTINFNIGGGGVKTISATGPEPTIVKPVTINGYTQGVATANTLAVGDNAVLLIELNGSGAGAGVLKVGIAVLTLGSGSGGSTIQGLVINRFSGDGILVRSDGNTIAGNFIGTNPAGTMGGTGFGNANTAFDLVTPFRAGVYVDNADNNVIGGTTAASRNVISGNILDNIHIVGNLAAGANNNFVQNNYVGVNAAGTGILFTSGFFGIEVSGVNASLNSVGGSTTSVRNVVGGNGDGIEFDDGAHDNLTQGNFSGLGADGLAKVGNRLHGIVLRDLGGSPGVSGNVIGGTVAGAGNTVANNGTAGIAIFGDPSVTPQNINNPILGNSVFNNGRNNPNFLLGIDLVSGTSFPTDDGNTPNDFGDGDTGPNHLQNFPVLTSALTQLGETKVTGTLNSRNNFGAGATYRIEFFATPTVSASGFGEGKTFLGFKEVTIGATPGPFVDQGQGTVSFFADLPIVPVGQVITATATQLLGGPGSTPLNTSEFSAPRAVSLRPTNVAVGSGDKLGKVAVVNLVLGNVVNSTSFSPFGKFKGEIHVANADFNGDGVNDFVVAQGKDGQAIVRVLNGTDPTGGTQLFQVAAYPSKFHGGVNVAAADVDGDGVPELITAPDSGKQPVEVFSGVGAHALLFTLSPFGTAFTDGVRVAAGDVNGDGRADLIMGAGPSKIGPRVLIVSGADTTVVLGDFKAFDSKFRGGVYVAAGDVNGDGRADVIVGAGADNHGPGAQVNVYDGGNFKGGFSSVITTFQAYAGFNGGVRVAAADFNGDGRADIITGPGPGKGVGPRLKAFIAATTSEVESFFVFDDPTYKGGLNL